MSNYIIQCCNLGDSGKGATVDWLCSTQPIDMVVRFNGGFQAAHNVVLSNGQHHCFSQFGSGTFRGVPTYVDSHVIVNPFAFQTEKFHLQRLGADVSQHHVHPDCLISTIYHQNLNRILEKRLGHGSCGVGIGATREMWSETGDGLFASDLLNKAAVKKKLGWIRQWCQDKTSNYVEAKGVDDINIAWDDSPISFTNELSDLATSGSLFHLSDESILQGCNSVVFEGAQGFKLDEVYGTIPHTTYSNTRPTYAVELCDLFGWEYKIIGVTRAYETRHGNGPMHSEYSPGLGPDVSQDHNFSGAFAGKFRTGELDLDNLERSAKICRVDTFAVSCLDHVSEAQGNWLTGYLGTIRPVMVKSYGPTADDRIASQSEIV